jgi:Uncharacterized protein conserved in bacteria
MKTEKKDKNPSIELLRIIAAFMVVGVHVNRGLFYFGSLRKAGCIISCFVADGVAIFWMIMGFFLFNASYKGLLKKSVKRILLPMMLFSLFMFIFGAYLSGSTSDILAGFKRPLAEYKNLITGGLLKWRDVVDYCGQFWYLYCYMIVVLFYPALKGIILEIKRKKKLFTILFIMLLINDIVLNGLMGFSNNAFPGAFAAGFIIILGYIIYQYKERFEDNKVLGLCGVAGYLVINAVRAMFQYKISKDGLDTNHILYWYTTFAVISVYCLIVFAFGFKGVFDKKYIKGIINHIGGITMGVYFVHPVVIARLENIGIMGKINAELSDNVLSIFIVQGKKMLLVFLCSAVIVELYELIRKALIMIICKKNDNDLF